MRLKSKTQQSFRVGSDVRGLLLCSMNPENRKCQYHDGIPSTIHWLENARHGGPEFIKEKAEHLCTGLETICSERYV